MISPNHPADLRTALLLHQAGQLDKAANVYREILARDPNNSDALHYLGLLEARAGHLERADTFIVRSLKLQPSNTQFRENYATILYESRRYDSAVQICDEILTSHPGNVYLLYVSAIALLKLKQLPEALQRFDKLLKVQPHHLTAINERGFALVEMKEYDKALSAFQKAIRLDPKFADAHINLGNLFGELDRNEEAKSSFEKALALNPGLARAWSGLGNILHKSNLFDKALTAFDKALALEYDLAEAWLGRGNVCAKLKHYDKALANYDRALNLKADLAEAWLGRGNVSTDLKQHDKAIAAYDRALSLKPDLALAWLGRGNVYTNLKRYDKAFAAYDQALSLKPELAEAWLGRGNVHADLNHHDNAFAAYDQALSLKPELAEAWLGRGNVYADLKQYDSAFAAYDRALHLNPDLKYVAGLRVHFKQHLCDWTNIEGDIHQLLSEVRAHKPVIPFVLLSIPSSPTEQLLCARDFNADRGALNFPALWNGEIYHHDRIRVAYLSADFGDHPVSYLMVGLFEQHDKSRFEITGLSLRPDQDSPMQRRLRGAFEHFVHVSDRSDQEIADLIRRLEIDIVVDLMGLTGNNRFNVLARRGAPIQVNYLGYAGTMGAGYIDYIIADSTVIPKDHLQFYEEQVVWLPESYQVNDDKNPISARTPTRSECGLPENGFVFCYFNNPYKITPEMFHVWMRLLKAVSDGVLWLGGVNPAAQANLRRVAERCDVSAQRLIFAPRLPVFADHLARHQLADLFLDTLPYNAHATARDALWAGVPLVTCLGSTFASRVAGSLLKAVGLDELIAHSLEDYEAMALQLAKEPSRLAALRDRLALNRNTYPLFDTKRFARHIEAAFLTMWERYQQGERPKAFTVTSA